MVMEQQNGGNAYTGGVCFYHPMKNRRTACVLCGKPLCADCGEAGQIVSGQKAGRSICFGCGEKLAEQNMELLQAERMRGVKYFVRFAAGIFIGFIAGGMVSGHFPYSMIFQGISGAVFRLFFVILGIILTCEAKVAADRFRSAYRACHFVPAYRKLTKVLKFFAGIFSGIFWALIQGIKAAVQSLSQNIGLLNKTPGTMERNLEIQRHIMEYRKASEKELGMNPNQENAKKELSRMMTQLLEENELYRRG